MIDPDYGTSDAQNDEEYDENGEPIDQYAESDSNTGEPATSDGTQGTNGTDGTGGTEGATSTREKEELKEFSPDCYLLDYIEEINKNKTAFNLIRDKGGVYFTTKRKLNEELDSKFNQIFSKISCRENLKLLSELTPLQIAGLHPKIDLFRIDKDGEKLKTRKFVFNYGTRSPIATGGDDFSFEDSQYRGGAGIKSVSYSLAGTNPVESERAIDVSITLYFNSVNDFIGLPHDGKNGIQHLLDYRSKTNNSLLYDVTDRQDQTGYLEDVTATQNYISLIERPTNEPNKYNGRDFQIVANIGYYVITSNDVIPKELRERVESMDLNLVLNLINHEMSFTEEGSVELKLNYFGTMQQYMNDPETDYFSKQFQEKKNSNTKLIESEKAISSLQQNIKDINKLF
jgi:hypothetical protein